ncbi:hypothetical protein KKHLCK_15515 [Candidatus Electrothrix laxa]
MVFGLWRKRKCGKRGEETGSRAAYASGELLIKEKGHQYKLATLFLFHIRSILRHCTIRYIYSKSTVSSSNFLSRAFFPNEKTIFTTSLGPASLNVVVN